MFIRITNVQFTTSVPITPNRCWWYPLLPAGVLSSVSSCYVRLMAVITSRNACLSLAVWLRIFYFSEGKEIFLFQFFLGSETCKLFDKALVVALAGVALAMCLQVWVGFLATFLVLLYWRTFYTSITAINTTVSLLWFQNSFTLFTFVKILAGICRHSFFFFVSAVGAGNSWFCYDFHIPKI